MRFLPMPTQFGYPADWHLDPRDPRPAARARAQAGMTRSKRRR